MNYLSFKRCFEGKQIAYKLAGSHLATLAISHLLVACLALLLSLSCLKTSEKTNMEYKRNERVSWGGEPRSQHQSSSRTLVLCGLQTRVSAHS